MAIDKEKRNKIILGSVSTLIVAGVIVIIIIKCTSTICECVSRIPTYDLSKLEPKVTKNFDGIIKFAGYLIYERNVTNSHLYKDEEKRIYMPLQLKSLSLSLNGDPIFKQSDRHLIIQTDCAKIMMNVLTSVDKSIKEISRIQVVLEEPNGEDRNCIIDEVDFYSDKIDQHYACYVTKILACKVKDDKNGAKKRTVAQLVLKAFEFEIDGDEKLIRKGKFSTKAKYC